MNNMKRQKYIVGNIVEIYVRNKYYCYAQILEKKNLAFFDYRSKTRLNDINTLLDCKILFVLGVYTDIITHGVWLKVGELPIREELRLLPMKYIYRPNDKYQWSLYNTNTGEITNSTKDECRGLELCSAWDSHHVEDRLNAYYEGTPCIWLLNDYEIFNDEYKYEIKRDEGKLFISKIIEENDYKYEYLYLYTFDEQFDKNGKYTLEQKKTLISS